jgi:hypothetical protein
MSNMDVFRDCVAYGLTTIGTVSKYSINTIAGWVAATRPSADPPAGDKRCRESTPDDNDDERETGRVRVNEHGTSAPVRHEREVCI